ncbi:MULTISPECIES: hypothetical protein [Streptomyces]|uniref:Uncharacterized protein n=2 Tax=Streptomyces TaxID=1883 RepID=A0AAE6TR46_STRPT|nr:MULTISPECIES: hypothetical protein [Streptomyces]MCF3143840.1 hypothetical protein [Streptomyces platensis]MCX4638982.1 hypothetical protein [Streptomyces platensis]OSY43815.1 hypothetical protein BG653_04337 [Streptomyces platensis]QEV56370.1 hypothetical protein CP981_36480 [Streptomyces platensis]QIY59316.1 hypothetical protein HEP86_38815 [Streptomyces sp. RPA4-5]
MSEFNLGDPLDKNSEEFVTTPPPVVLRVQPSGFVRLKTPEQLRAWEKAVRQTTGLEIVADNLAGVAAESGCEFGEASHSDACDMA